MTLALAIAVLLSAVPPVGVALSSNRPDADAQAAQALARVEQALTNARVPGLLTSAETKKRLAGDSKNCAGGRKCLTELALQLDARAVLIGVDVARVADDVVVHLEAVTAGAQRPLVVKDVTVRLKNFPDGASGAISALARELKRKLGPAEVGKASDAPVAEPEVTAPNLAANEGPLGSRWGPEKGIRGTTVAGVMTSGAAVVAAAMAVAFSVLAANDKAQWDQSRYIAPDGSVGTTLSAADADALVNQGNARFTVALSTGIGAAALAITSVILLTR